MDLDNLTAWVAIFRDVAVVLVAAFILTYETVVIADPNPYLIGAGLTLLGAPAAIRVDQFRRKAQKGADDAEKWTHLP